MVADSQPKKDTLKFLCSYGGKIMPCPGDGRLRYVGGVTRVVAVAASISYAELMVKLGEYCGYSVELRCQLPNGDLETLISIKSDEELTCLTEEYKRRSPDSKIRAVLIPQKPLKTVSPPSTPSSFAPNKSKYSFGRVSYTPPIGYPVNFYNKKQVGRLRYDNPVWACGNPRFWCSKTCCSQN